MVGREWKLRRGRREERRTHHPLEIADNHPVEDLARFIGVADVFEGFGGILSGDVE